MTRSILYTAIAIGLFTFSINVSAQEKTLATVKETQQLSYEVSKLFKEGNLAAAFDKMDLYLPLPADEKAELRNQTIKYKSVLESRLGKRVGFKRATEKRIEDVAIREVYFVLHELSAIRLIFTYYKSPEGWILNSFKWDDSFAEELE
jgi:hypothetical protein